MKCPKCGHWNKPSFPRCFQCGEPLTAKDTKQPAWQETFEKPRPVSTRVVYDDTAPPKEDVVIDEEALDKVEPDETLAAEMIRLKERRARGSVYLEEFRKNATEQGIAPSGKGVSIHRSGGFFTNLPDDPMETVYEPPEMRERSRTVSRRQKPLPTDDTQDAAPDEDDFIQIRVDTNSIDYDEDLPPGYDDTPPLAPRQTRRKRKRRRAYGPMVAAVWVVRVLVLAVAAFVVWQGILYWQLRNEQSLATVDAEVTMESAQIDGHSGQRIQIAGEEGALIYIPELSKSYVVVGGVATVEVADHVYYDAIENLEAAQMDITLSPTKTYLGNETRLTPISYTIDIPASYVRLLSPESTWVEVSTSIYNMELEVTPGSKVTINGEDKTDTVGENGVVYANPSIQAIGENIVTVTVKAPYCRETNMTVTFYRPTQDISLELAATTQLNTWEDSMTIRATTEVGASITIESPTYSVSAVDPVTGEFTIVARMERVGYNTIRIRASMPGREDSVLEHTVYYVPPASTYTPKAWALSASDYNELLNNITLRTQNAQIYLCKGVVTEILSENPQLAIMDTGTDGKEQLVLLQNESATKWELGKTYRVYADVSGLYGSIPRLNGRYTYLVE